MVARLRGCAADTSPNWDGRVTIYPPEARELVALIDASASDDEGMPPIADHVFRTGGGTYVAGIAAGMCAYDGRCNRPQDDHITRPDFQALRGAR
jgi:hypothetical protein